MSKNDKSSEPSFFQSVPHGADGINPQFEIDEYIREYGVIAVVSMCKKTMETLARHKTDSYGQPLSASELRDVILVKEALIETLERLTRIELIGG